MYFRPGHTLPCSALCCCTGRSGTARNDSDSTHSNLNVALRKPPSKILQPLHNHAHVFNARSVTAGKAPNYTGCHLNKIPRKYKPTTQLFPEKETSSKLSENVKTYNEGRSELYFSLLRDSSSHISFYFWKPQIMQSFSPPQWVLVLQSLKSPAILSRARRKQRGIVPRCHRPDELMPSAHSNLSSSQVKLQLTVVLGTNLLHISMPPDLHLFICTVRTLI